MIPHFFPLMRKDQRTSCNYYANWQDENLVTKIKKIGHESLPFFSNPTMTKIWWHSIVIFGSSRHHLTTFTIRIEYSVGKLKDFEKNACVSGHSRVRHPTQMSLLSDTNVDKKVPMISRTSFGAENSHCVARNFPAFPLFRWVITEMSVKPTCPILRGSHHEIWCGCPDSVVIKNGLIC